MQEIVFARGFDKPVILSQVSGKGPGEHYTLTQGGWTLLEIVSYSDTDWRFYTNKRTWLTMDDIDIILDLLKEKGANGPVDYQSSRLT